MRKILLVAVLVLSGCGKKASTPKGDCGVAVDNAMNLSKEDFKKSNVADATVPKIRDASVARCKEDKWSDKVLQCLTDAKASDDIKKCQQMMTKEQNDNMAKAITAAMATQPAPEPEGSGSETGSGSSAEPGSAAAPIAGLPEECAEYKSMIEKLAKCEKMPQASRDLLVKTFDETAKAWANLDKMPDTAKAAMKTGCKGGVDALKKAAGAICGF